MKVTLSSVIMAWCRSVLVVILVAALARAAEEAPVVKLVRALEDGNPNAKEYVASGTVDSTVLLHTAAQYGLAKAASFLINTSGVSASAALGNTGAPLHTAAEYGQVEVARLLIENGAAVNEPNMRGFRPLHFAAKSGRVKLIKLLFEHGATLAPASLHVPAELQFAAAGGHASAIKQLIKRGAEIDSISLMVGGKSSLHVATEGGHVKAMRTLISSGATLDQRADGGNTALHQAAALGKDKAVSLLFKSGATLDQANDKGETALHVSAIHGRTSTAKLLVELGANVEAREQKEITPLYFALRYGKLDTALALVDAGAALDHVSVKGLTPLRDVAQEGMLGAVEFILGLGANENVRDLTGASALHAAAREGHLEVVKLLVAHRGASVYARDNQGASALHGAAQEGRVDVVRFLILSGADVNARTDAGHTPLHAAAFEGQLSVAEVLVANGASLDARTLADLTAVDVAVYQHQHTMVEWLRRNAESVSPSETVDEHDTGGLEVGACDAAGKERARENHGNRVVTIDPALETALFHPWPWVPRKGCSLPTHHVVIGAVNVSYRIARMPVFEWRVHALHALPVLRVVQPRDGASSGLRPVLTSEHAQAAALHTGPFLGDAARSLVLTVERLRRELATQMAVSSTSFWAAHFPLATLATKLAKAEEEAAVETTGAVDGPKKTFARRLREMQTAFDAFEHKAKIYIALFLGCSFAQLQCPRFGGYQRIEQDHFLGWFVLIWRCCCCWWWWWCTIICSVFFLCSPQEVALIQMLCVLCVSQGSPRLSWRRRG